MVDDPLSFSAYAQQWSEITPRRTNICACSEIIPAYLNAGDDILVEIDSTISPCRIVEVIQTGNVGAPPVLLVSMWVFEDRIAASENLESLNCIRYSNVMGMKGVVYTNRLRKVYLETVMDFAFIFHCDSIQSGQFASAHGIQNAYYTRFKLFTAQNSMNTVSTLMLHEHHPFSNYNKSSFFPESGHHRIFQFLTQMKKNADSVLWSERKFQRSNGRGRSNPLFINQECWTYFCNRLKNHPSFFGEIEEPNQTTRSLRTFFHDLSSQSVSLPTRIHTIEAYTADHFKVLRSLFGTGYGFGVRRSRDTKKSGTSVLAVTEQINALDFFSEGTDNGRVSNQEENSLDAPEISNKVVFCYNFTTSFVTVRYYYRYVRVNSDRGRNLLREINHRIAMNSNHLVIAEGSTFFFEGAMYKTGAHFAIIADVSVVNMYDGSERILNCELVHQLIQQHNANDDNDSL